MLPCPHWVLLLLGLISCLWFPEGEDLSKRLLVDEGNQEAILRKFESLTTKVYR